MMNFNHDRFYKYKLMSNSNFFTFICVFIHVGEASVVLEKKYCNHETKENVQSIFSFNYHRSFHTRLGLEWGLGPKREAVSYIPNHLIFVP